MIGEIPTHLVIRSEVSCVSSKKDTQEKYKIFKYNNDNFLEATFDLHTSQFWRADIQNGRAGMVTLLREAAKNILSFFQLLVAPDVPRLQSLPPSFHAFSFLLPVSPLCFSLSF